MLSSNPVGAGPSTTPLPSMSGSLSPSAPVAASLSVTVSASASVMVSGTGVGTACQWSFDHYCHWNGRQLHPQGEGAVKRSVHPLGPAPFKTCLGHRSRFSSRSNSHYRGSTARCRRRSPGAAQPAARPAPPPPPASAPRAPRGSPPSTPGRRGSGSGTGGGGGRPAGGSHRSTNCYFLLLRLTCASQVFGRNGPVLCGRQNTTYTIPCGGPTCCQTTEGCLFEPCELSPADAAGCDCHAL